MSTSSRRRLVALSAAVLTVLALSAGPAQAQGWAPAATATIHPGVMMFTAGAQCTANFVFTGGGNVYLGYAAHCAGTGAATDTNGCDAGTLPLGTAVEIDGATRPGTLVYSSWIAMQAAGETDPDLCAFNDFAAVRIDPADVGSVNPSVPDFGGPVAVNTGGTGAGDQVYSYGNSSLRLGLTPFSPKYGVSLGGDAGTCTHTVYTATPGIPGDSGSGFLDANGNAFGVLSTVAIAPLPLSNGVSDLSCNLAYAASHGFSGQLAPGTEPFSPLI